MEKKASKMHRIMMYLSLSSLLTLMSLTAPFDFSLILSLTDSLTCSECLEKKENLLVVPAFLIVSGK
jgi:hypothetical protein